MLKESVNEENRNKETTKIIKKNKEIRKRENLKENEDFA